MRSIAKVICLAAAVTAQRREMPKFTINLDLDPEDRFTEVSSDPLFNATVWDYYNTNIAPNPALQKVLYGISAKRGDECDEMMGELRSIQAGECTTALPRASATHT